MFRTEAQQCRAIQLLLGSLRLQHLWTATGPTKQACEYLESNPLSHGEDIWLRCAFDLWNGAGKVGLYEDILGGVLDDTRIEKLTSLIVAINRGGDAVDEWIKREETTQGYMAQESSYRTQ